MSDFPPRGAGGGMTDVAPNATWQRPESLGAHWHYAPGKLLLGKVGARALAISDDRHAVMIAGARGGKTSTVLVPNLLRYPGSALVLDPKGELAKATASARKKMGQDVYVLDPFGETDAASDSHNPFDELGYDRPKQIAADASLFGDGLIIQNDKDPHWTEAAKNLMRGTALYLLAVDRKRANLKTLRQVLHYDAERMEGLFKAMADAPEDLFNGVVRNTGSSYLSKLINSPREFHGILSTLQEQTAPLDDVIPITGHSDFSFADFKKRTVTVYLVLPGMRMGTHARWLRMLVQQAMAAMERTPTRPGALPVWFVLEEFAALGYLRSIETAAGYMAGFGMKLWSVLQDLSQLKTHYPNSWETFLGNAGVIQAFGNADVTTVEHLAKMMGHTNVVETQDVQVSGAAMAHGDLGRREHVRQYRLLEPDEIVFHFARETNRQLILVPGSRPIFMERLPPPPPPTPRTEVAP